MKKRTCLIMFTQLCFLLSFAQIDSDLNKALAKSLNKGTKEYIDGDLHVIGRLGLGSEVVNGQMFGSYVTKLYKENNLRILFEDSSIDPDPTNDWQIELNNSLPGGGNYFKIRDIDGGTSPFTIQAGAPDHSLYVSNQSVGDSDYSSIGIGTNAPQTYLHVFGNSGSAIRLDQSGGASPSQYWEMGCNASYFYIKDVTNSGKIPLKIEYSNTSVSDLYLRNGNIGIGPQFTNSSPSEKLEVNGDMQVDSYFYIGDESTDDSWRISNVNGVLTFEVRENGIWNTAFEVE